MRLALGEAERAAEHDDVPIGALVVRKSEVLCAAKRARAAGRSDPRMPKVLAIARPQEDRRLAADSDAVLVRDSRLACDADVRRRDRARSRSRVVYGAPDPKAGAAGRGRHLGEPRLESPPQVDGGLLAEGGALLNAFFSARR
jgi:tRNA(adenine34) deaminase